MTTLLQQAFTEAANWLPDCWLNSPPKTILTVTSPAPRINSQPWRGRRLPSTAPGKRKPWIRSGYEFAHDAAVPRPLGRTPSSCARASTGRLQAIPRQPVASGIALVHPAPPTYSARVGIGYRAVSVMDGETVTWFWIGSHGDYDKLLKQL